MGLFFGELRPFSNQHPVGDRPKQALGVQFDGNLRLEFNGVESTSAAAWHDKCETVQIAEVAAPRELLATFWTASSGSAFRGRWCNLADTATGRKVSDSRGHS